MAQVKFIIKNLIIELQEDPVTFEISLADSDLEKARLYLEKELWPQSDIDFVLDEANEDDRHEAYRYAKAIRKIWLIKNKQVIEFHNFFVKNEFYFEEELSDTLDEIDKQLSNVIFLYETGYSFQINEKVEYAHGQFKEKVLPLLQDIKQPLRKTIEIEMPESNLTD